MLGVLAIAIHIDGQSAVTQAGEVAGAPLGVVVQAPELMHHHDARARAFYRVIVSVIANHPGAVATLIRDFLSLDGGLGQPAGGEQEEGEEHAHGRISYKKIIKQLGGYGSAQVKRAFRVSSGRHE
ncbi:hypothetical protein D3C81_1569150 [compost metagenome]